MAKKYTLWVLVGILVIIAFFAGTLTQSTNITNQKDEQKSTEPITLGFIAPLSGDVAAYGRSEQHATQLAIDEINNHGGILGRELEVVYEDGKCDGKEAANAAQKLINIDKVKIILGGACSGETLAIAPITEENHIILYSAFSTSPDITEAGAYVFRGAPSDLQRAKQLAVIIQQRGFKRPAIITEQTSYAGGLTNRLVTEFDNLDISIVANEVYQQESRDMRTQLEKIINQKPDVLIVNSQGGITGGMIVKQLAEYQYDYNIDLFGFNDVGSSEAMEIAGKSLDGLIFVDAPGLHTSNSKAQMFLTNYKTYYKEEAPSEFEIAARYDSVYIIAGGIESCGGVDTDCIKNYLYNTTYEGTIGTYSFDAHGDPVGLEAYTVKQIINAEKGDIIELQ